ncbi:HD domain-containing protein [Thalassiella azotivora]
MSGRDHPGRPGGHLVSGFVDACRELGATAPVVDLEGAAVDLVRRWSAPARGYHDVEHLEEVLGHLEELGGGPAERLAAWFHDAVYDGRPGQDEEESAQLAARELTALGCPPAVADEVAALVRVTAAHEPAPGDAAAERLCDADLAVLASAPERYRRYVDGVRHEYGHLDDAVFAAGRAHVLQVLLDRGDALYRTESGRRRWSATARANLERELTALRADAG